MRRNAERLALENPRSPEFQFITSSSVKSTSPTTEKWLRKLYVYSNNIHMSDEDNNHDTNYINKFHDANHDTRKLHH